MRRLDRLLALVLGLALTAVAVVAAVEAVQLRRGRPAVVVPRATWDDHLRQLDWGDGSLRTTAGVIVAVGAVLLVTQLLPRRTLRYALRSEEGRPTWISRGSLDRILAATASQDPDVLEATAKTTTRRASVAVTVPRSVDRDELRTRLTAAVTEELGTLDVARPPAVTVRARHAKDRVR